VKTIMKKHPFMLVTARGWSKQKYADMFLLEPLFCLSPFSSCRVVLCRVVVVSCSIFVMHILNPPSLIFSASGLISVHFPDEIASKLTLDFSNTQMEDLGVMSNIRHLILSGIFMETREEKVKTLQRQDRTWQNSDKMCFALTSLLRNC
jgi:hypothetical protein